MYLLHVLFNDDTSLDLDFSDFYIKEGVLYVYLVNSSKRLCFSFCDIYYLCLVDKESL